MDEEVEEAISYETPIGKVLLEMTQLAKKPQLDDQLSLTLDKFIEQLKKANVYLEEGISFNRFPESAMILQRATEIFGKKVDMIWKELMSFRQRQIEYIREDEKEKQKQKEQVSEVELNLRETQKLIREANQAEAEPEPEPVETNENWSLDSDDDLSVYDDVLDVWPKDVRIGHDLYYEIFNNLPADRTSGIYGHIYRRNGTVYDEDEEETYRIGDIYSTDEFFDDICNDSDTEDEEVRIEYMNQSNYYEHAEKGPMNVPSRVDFIKGYKLYSYRREYPIEPAVILERLPDDLVSEKLRRMSVKPDENDNFTDSGFFDESEQESSVSGNVEQSGVSENENESEGTENMEEPSVTETPEEVSVSQLIIPPEFKERLLKVVLIREKLKVTRNKRRKSVLKLEPNVDEISDSEEVLPIKRKRISKVSIEKLCTGVSADLHLWESFHCMNYYSQDDEGEVMPYKIPENSTVHDSVDDVDQIESDIDNSDTINETDEGVDEGNTMNTTQTSLEDTTIECTDSTESPNETVSSTPSCSRVKDFRELLEVHGDREGVVEWKLKTKQLIKNATSKCFDVHEYETNLLSSLSPNEPKLFKELMEGKDRVEKIRFCVSALHLASNENIELLDAIEGKICNDTLKLKLLNTNIHHEDIQQFAVPTRPVKRPQLLNSSVEEVKRIKVNESSSVSEIIPSEESFRADLMFCVPGPSTSAVQRQSTPIRFIEPYNVVFS